MVSDAARMPHIVAAPDIASGADIVVLGLGNTLRRDEGLGIHALERLRIDYTFSPAPLFVDGGTLGLELISYLEDAERILILDATLTGGEPGALLRLAGDDLPVYLGMRVSPHEIGLADLLAVARLRGFTPSEVVVLGMQPEALELGLYLSEPVRHHLNSLVDAAIAELACWGIQVTPAPVRTPQQYGR